MSHPGHTPLGTFFCKGCQKHRPIAVRVGKYGKYCVDCHKAV